MLYSIAARPGIATSSSSRRSVYGHDGYSEHHGVTILVCLFFALMIVTSVLCR
ncbi:hypothetical protein BGW80DRAFT_1305717 [Lactifluus volemus]|nr:hypothetical protein BGW80DRAFT_1305717 [Lactifluus volemus]